MRLHPTRINVNFGYNIVWDRSNSPQKLYTMGQSAVTSLRACRSRQFIIDITDERITETFSNESITDHETRSFFFSWRCSGENTLQANAAVFAYEA